jgi:hypothetical protein
MEIVISNNTLTIKQAFKLSLYTSYIAYVIFGCFLVSYMYFDSPSMFTTGQTKDLLAIPIGILFGSMFNAFSIAITCSLLMYFINRFSISQLSPIRSNVFSQKGYFFFIGVGVFILCIIMFWPIAFFIQSPAQPTWFIALILIMPLINGIFNGAALCGATALLQRLNLLSFTNAN